MITGFISIALQILPPILKWMGFREDQIQKFIVWVQNQQKDAPSGTIPSDQEAAARAQLLDRINKEKQ